jgi:hypothetical protein
MHVAWVNVSEIGIRGQTAKVEINSNGCMIAFTVRWGNDIGFVYEQSKSLADRDQINFVRIWLIQLTGCHVTS